MTMDAATLKSLLAEDQHQANLYLRFRDYVRFQVINLADPANRRELDIAKYEFANVYSRFYMSMRNGGMWRKFWSKMLSEFEQKKLPYPQDWKRKNSIKEFVLDDKDAFFNIERQEEVLLIEDEKVNIVQYRYNDLILQMPEERHADLLKQATQYLEKIENCTSTPFEVLKTTAASYLPASGSLYWGFGPEVYSYAKMSLFATLEAYASPFNYTLDAYCSPFELDRVFGSLGSFYKLDTCDHKVIIANPPYIESELFGCAEKVKRLCDDARLVISIWPHWEGTDGLDALRSHEKCIFTQNLPAREHQYYNYQRAHYIRATFPSLGFCLGNDLALAEAARGLFCLLVPTQPASKKPRW